MSGFVVAVVDELEPASICHLFRIHLHCRFLLIKITVLFLFSPPTPSPVGNRKSKLLQVDLKWRRHPLALVYKYMYLSSTGSAYPLSTIFVLAASLITVCKCVLYYFCCFRPILWTHVFCRGWTFMPSCCHKAGMVIMKD